jgi:hypothetical protein
MQAVRDAIERRDADGLMALLGKDVIFRSPAVHTPYHGREQVRASLLAVSQLLEDFRYTHEIGASARDHALVFRGRVGDREVEGCDFIHLDDEGLIDELHVMVRALPGLMALAEAMTGKLAVDTRDPRREQTA